MSVSSPHSHRISVRPSDVVDVPGAHVETPTPKDEGPPLKIVSPLGRELAACDDVGRAVAVAEAFGSGTQIWFRGRQVGTYERGRNGGQGSVPRSVVRRRLRDLVALRVRLIERAEARYIERVRAEHPADLVA